MSTYEDVQDRIGDADANFNAADGEWEALEPVTSEEMATRTFYMLESIACSLRAIANALAIIAEKSDA